MKSMSSSDNFYQLLGNIQDSNNSIASISADKANAFTWKSQMEAQRYNATEAQKNRDFQLMQGNTAHQREVTDLIRAGLNPVLSANNGAAVTSGATASVGTSSGIKADVDMQKASLLAQWKMNKVNNAQALKIAKLNNKNAMDITKLNTAASMYGANASAAASRFAAMQAAGAAMYGAGLNYQLGQDRLQYDRDHPSNMYEAIGEILSRLGDGGLGLTNGYNEPNTSPKTSDKGNRKTGHGRT